jgi:hypothetical protein
VAGVAGLVWAHYPDMYYLDVKDCILDNADAIPALSGITITGGRLNAEQAVLCPGADTSSASGFNFYDEKPGISDVQYIAQAKQKLQPDELYRYGYFGMLLIPVFFIIGWKNQIKRKAEKL